MCLTLGGDLLSKNIGPNGAQYHALVLIITFLIISNCFGLLLLIFLMLISQKKKLKKNSQILIFI